MIQYFIDIILVRFPDPLVQSESGNLTIKPSPYLAGPSLHFTLLSCLLSIVLIFICPVSSPTPFCPISLFDFPYRAFWFVLSQLFHPFSSAGPWPIFSGRSPLLKSRSRSGHLSVFSAFKRRWWREWRQSKVDHGAITVKEELVWWNTGDVSFCWTKWHHINQMLPKKNERNFGGNNNKVELRTFTQQQYNFYNLLENTSQHNTRERHHVTYDKVS